MATVAVLTANRLSCQPAWRVMAIFFVAPTYILGMLNRFRIPDLGSCDVTKTFCFSYTTEEAVYLAFYSKKNTLTKTCVYGMGWYGMRYGVVRYGTVCYGMVRYGTVCTVRYGMLFCV